MKSVNRQMLELLLKNIFSFKFAVLVLLISGSYFHKAMTASNSGKKQS